MFERPFAVITPRGGHARASKVGVLCRTPYTVQIGTVKTGAAKIARVEGAAPQRGRTRLKSGKRTVRECR